MYNLSMKNSDNNKFEVDFSKMDASIKDLLDVIVKQEFSEKKNIKEEPRKRVKKKLNVDSTRDLMIETKELRQKGRNAEKNNEINLDDLKNNK